MNPRRAVWLVGLAALVLRLGLLALRGDYIVYDEGYYLLLARSLRESHTFALNGLPHVALSPLQPLLVAVVSLFGVPDLWASRLLAAACGALLVLPVAALANRWLGARGAVGAAAVTAVAPALLTFLPFFPGEGWNLYFGSEPLYLLLAVSALAAAARAADGGAVRWWLLAGALASLAYLTRLEGGVLAAGLLVSVAAWLRWRRRTALWPRAVLAAAAGALLATPYLVYLHSTLGRWALSGRVQAAAGAAAPAGAPARAAGSGGSDAVNEFVWGGEPEALWRTLYALDASGTRMASQYWGVSRPAAPRATGPRPPAGITASGARPDTSRAVAAAPASRQVGRLSTAAQALVVVLPVWLLVLAGYGFVRVPQRLEVALWLAPLALAALVPTALAYAEPRALLSLVPVGTVLAAGGVLDLASRLATRLRRPALVPASLGAVVAVLIVPTVRNAVRAWSRQTPLQQVATAQRAVGEYLGAHLPGEDRLMSWHPALAVWARREWRVLPYEPFDRIVRYARAEKVGAIVFSRFNPSPLREPPRAFTAVLPGAGGEAPVLNAHLEPVAETPLLFVGRLAGPER